MSDISNLGWQAMGNSGAGSLLQDTKAHLSRSGE